MAKGIVLGVAWFLVGGAVGLLTAGLFSISALGGQQTPPAWWGPVVLFGVFGMTPVLALSGIPAAVRLARGGPWLKLALTTFAVDVTLWMVTMVSWEIGRPKA